jgi:hypothetical protein
VRSAIHDKFCDARVQFLAADVRDRYANPEMQPLNERERAVSSKVAIPIFHYHATKVLDLGDHVGNVVEVVLSIDDLVHAARNTKKRHIWGDHVYTADTDLFAAMVHEAVLPSKCTEQPFAWPSAVLNLRAILRVKPPQKGYQGTLRNGMRSRSWPNKCFDFSYSLERVWMIVRIVRCCLMSSSLDGWPPGLLQRCLLAAHVLACCLRQGTCATAHQTKAPVISLLAWMHAWMHIVTPCADRLLSA